MTQINHDSEFLFLTLFAFLSLFGLFFVSTFMHVARRLRKETTQKYLKDSKLFYFHLHKLLFGESLDTLLFCLTCVQHILRLFYILFVFAAFLGEASTSGYFLASAWESFSEAVILLGFLLLTILSFILFADILPRMWAYHKGMKAASLATKVSSLFLFLFLPITFILYRLMRLWPNQRLNQTLFSPFSEAQVASKDKLLEVIRDIDEGSLLSEHDKKLMQSVFTFRDRIAREVMVPRVNLSCIPHDATLKKAADLFEKEGYSRIPVYKNSIDEVVGVLMYKDLLKKFMQPNVALEESIEPLVKSVIYTPETKKISQLLQDFRKKRAHIAIVVDEYGGTAGIVTIEDILEEIVGEIADEYDDDAVLFKSAGKGIWIVDARMNLLDLEEELGIKIPQEGEYDTIAGYIFFRLGTIPSKGTSIHHDEFELEIVQSNDRVVEKVKIISTQPTSILKQEKK